MALYYFLVEQTSEVMNFSLWSSKPVAISSNPPTKHMEDFDHVDEKVSTPSSPTSVWSMPSSARSSFNDSEIDSSSVSSPDLESTDKSVEETTCSAQIDGGVADEEHGVEVPDMAEIRVVFERFDENGDGLICAKDLLKFAQRLGYSMSLEDAKVLVVSSDRNKDGRLDFEEFYSLYQSLGKSCPEVRRLTEKAGLAKEEHEGTMEEAFGVYDADKNGHICAKELQSVLRKMGLPEGRSLRHCERVMRRVASNPLKGMTLGEFKSMMCSKTSQPCSLKASKSLS